MIFSSFCYHNQKRPFPGLVLFCTQYSTIWPERKRLFFYVFLQRWCSANSRPSWANNVLREHPVLAPKGGGPVGSRSVEVDRTGGGFVGGQTAGQQGRRHPGQQRPRCRPGKGPDCPWY